MARNPHDALFKATFSNPEHAAGELRVVLPPAIVQRIDFASLRLEPGSFVDKAFRDRHSDILYSAKLGRQRALFYVLLEHHSTVDPLLPLRVLGYEVRIWEGYVREHPRAKRLPAIISVVVHHSESGWTAPTKFEDLLRLDGITRTALHEHLVRFRVVLDDISRETDEALRQRAMSALAQLSLWCLRDGRKPGRLVQDLLKWRDLAKKVLAAPNGTEAFGLIVQYIEEMNRAMGVDELKALVAKVAEEKTEAVLMTLTEQARQEGRIAEARAVLRRILEVRHLKVTRTAAKQIDACADLSTLERWLEQAAVASSLAEALQ